jgi:uncharacterized membrane protein
VISLYLTYSWYVEGICLPCAYEHAQSDSRFYVQIAEYYYSEIYGVPVSILSIIVFTIVSMAGLSALIGRIGIRQLALIAAVLLLPALAYGSYLQYVALFVLNKLYPVYTLLYLDMLIVTVLSVRMLFTIRRAVDV